MCPSISGGTRVDMFNSEFLSRLSLIMSPFPSPIRFSKARIESMLASGPILGPVCVNVVKAAERIHVHRFQCLLLIAENRHQLSFVPVGILRG